MHILLVCGHPPEAKRIQRGLRDYCYAVDIASSNQAAEAIIAEGHFDAILVQDGQSDQVDAIRVTRRLRDQDVGDPVMVIAETFEERFVAQAFDAGADQVMDPDHNFDELLARVRGLMRQCEATVAEKLTYHDVEMDLSRLDVTRGGQPLGLIGKPLAMLEYFMRNPEKILRRETIGESVWDRNFDPFSNVIDVTVSKVRQKLDKPFGRPYIHTVVGEGYIFSRNPPAGR